MEACGAAIGSCWERSVTQSAGGITDGTVNVDSGVANVSPEDWNHGDAEADGIAAGTESVVDLTGLALLSADTPTGGGDMDSV